jgi:RNA polymerase sigma-70 factor (ECF subfamily)
MFRFRWTKRTDDEALMLEFGRGDCRAFEEIVGRYGGAIEGYARRLLQNRQLAEEVVADTFERLARERGNGSLHGTLRGYLFTIAHHRCMDLLRKRRRELEASSTVAERERGRGLPTHPEAIARLGELAAALEDALRRLPEAHREVVLLRLVHGLSGDETARVLGVSEDQIRSQLSYARKLLRKYLAEQVGTEPVLEYAEPEKEFEAI